LARLGLVEKGAGGGVRAREGASAVQLVRRGLDLDVGDVGKVLLTAELLEKEASIRDVCEAERRAGAAKIAAVEAVVARVEGEAAGGERLALEALRGAEAAARRASGDAQAELDRLKRMHQVRDGPHRGTGGWQSGGQRISVIPN